MFPPPHTVISLLSSKVAEQEEVPKFESRTNTNNNNVSNINEHAIKVTKAVDFTKLFHNPIADLVKAEELEEPKQPKTKSKSKTSGKEEVTPTATPTQPRNSNEKQTNTNTKNTNTKSETGLKRSDSFEELVSQGEDDWIATLSREKRKETKKEEWALELNMDMKNFQDLVPKMAIEYPFDLDFFQKEAVYHLENNESVFVAAHTSAGKTVVAEYAIALSKKHLTRVIYTSPIKALSNQKFRDFKKTFDDVGLITGDVSINPEASCLIMTIEILRSMLYRGADILRDVEWVVFDEVHYINDKDRGVVWEEVIIMLPDHVGLIMLSATIPNKYEFADWIGRTKKKKVYIVGTNKRPVALEHYLYTADDLWKVVDSKSTFLKTTHNNAMVSLKKYSEKSKAKPNQHQSASAKQKQDVNEYNKLINMLKDRTLLPAIVFSFSKKKCETLAYGLSTVNLTTAVEKSQIHQFIEESLTRLKGTDKKLPQVQYVKEILKRGIGLHHGGLLPIVKEMVEILFARGLIKVLFATETFAMGVNMPARTVIFSSLQKHDKESFRDLHTAEYIQMSGRAGRRGLDTVGTVIICCWQEVPESAGLISMILGKATELKSQFHLTYNMILNLLRVSEFRVEDVLKRSFSEFASQRLVPQQQKLLQKANDKLQSIDHVECILGEPDIENFYKHYTQYTKYDKSTTSVIMQSKPALQALDKGRVVVVDCLGALHVGMTLKMTTKGSSKAVSVLIVTKQSLINAEAKQTIGAFTLSSPNIVKGDTFHTIDVELMNVKRITKSKLKVDSDDKNSLNTAKQELLRVLEENPLGPAEMDVVKDFKLNALDFNDDLKNKNTAFQKMCQSKCLNCPKLPENLEIMDKTSRLQNTIQSLRYALSEQNLELMPEFETRLEVLKRLSFIDQDNTVLLKGRVAREINTCTDELIATELVFENVLTPLTPEEIVALLSCLIYEEKEKVEPAITDNLNTARSRLVQIASNLAEIQIAAGLPLNVTEYLESRINFSLMEVVYEWANATPFSDITSLTAVPEGSIVRCIVRLDETCREIRNAARIIGDTTLYAKMERSSQLIKRDIVFATSLYI